MLAPCPLHDGIQMEEKDGQYGIYFSHRIEGVGYCNGKRITPFRVKPTPIETTREPLAGSSPKERDYDAEARGKIRFGFIKAKIHFNGLTKLTNEQVNLINDYTEYSMTGIYPSRDNDEF